jgi:mannose-6-phosphate isomerase-like protein (cupin superfamily)
VFASDTEVEPITVGLAPGADFYRIWGGDERASFPDDGSHPAAPAYFPGPNGFRFGVFTVAPDSVTIPKDIDLETALGEMEERPPGLVARMEPDNPGMHTTATIDYEIVISGRVVLELDDGATRELGPGDTVIQNGTRHAWRNPSQERQNPRPERILTGGSVYLRGADDRIRTGDLNLGKVAL